MTRTNAVRLGEPSSPAALKTIPNFILMSTVLAPETAASSCGSSSSSSRPITAAAVTGRLASGEV